MSRKRSKEYLATAALKVSSKSALETDAIAYMPRFMANVAFPTRKLATNEYNRRNGHYQMTLVSAAHIGLPYGSYPRQIIIYLATKAKLTRNRSVHIGSSQADLLSALGVKSTGGKTGTIQAFCEQSKRLFACTFLLEFSQQGKWSIETMRVTNKASLTWQPQQVTQWQASLLLEDGFYQDIIQHAIPIDSRVIRAFTHYPLAMDIYCWLTYRYFRLKKPQRVSWETLAQQFGNTYNRKSNFIRKFKRALGRVKLFYPMANYDITTDGLMLYPSEPHVAIYADKSCG